MVLKFLNDDLLALNIPYAFWEWSGDVPETYFVGEYSESASNSEDGLISGEIILSGFTRGTYSDLEQIRDQVYAHFRNGERYLESGKGAVIGYSHSQVVPSNVENVKRLEIYLWFREWSI